MKTAIIVISAVLGGIILISLITAHVIYEITFNVRKRELDPFYGLDGELTEKKKASRDHIAALVAIEDYEDVYITSFDGLRLHGRYYHVRDGAPLEIQMHGYRSLSTHDFSAGALECMKLGNNLLLIDHRAHGESEGHIITFGIKERYDALSWCEYAARRFGDEVDILLYGISMGGGTVLMASELPLPECVRGIVADCPYSTPVAIIEKVMRDMHLPSLLFRPFLYLSARLFGGFNIGEASPLEAVKNTKTPILILHGEGDNFVPCDMSREIAEAGATTTLATFKEAGHGLSFLYDYDGYMRQINAFHARVLTKRADNDKI